MPCFGLGPRVSCVWCDGAVLLLVRALVRCGMCLYKHLPNMQRTCFFLFFCCVTLFIGPLCIVLLLVVAWVFLFEMFRLLMVFVPLSLCFSVSLSSVFV